jgi:hypothetical protein
VTFFFSTIPTPLYFRSICFWLLPSSSSLAPSAVITVY